MPEKKLLSVKRIGLSFLCLFCLAQMLALVFEPTVTAQQSMWRFELEEGKTAISNLQLNNSCKMPHNFTVKEDMKYLTFTEPTESILIAPGATRPVGVKFDPTGLETKVYKGVVNIICLDCKAEPGCAQDTDKVSVQLTVKPAADDSKDRENKLCLPIMAAEIYAYIKEKKILLKVTNSRFFSNEDEQVYMVSSNEPLNLSSKEPVPSTFAVINAKDKSGKSVFYTLEREVKSEMITYTVRQDSTVVQTVEVRTQSLTELGLTPNVPNWDELCAAKVVRNEAAFEDATNKANKSCRTQYYTTCNCTKGRTGGTEIMCFSANRARPTAASCYRDKAANDWRKTSNLTPLVNEAVDSAIEDQMVSSF